MALTSALILSVLLMPSMYISSDGGTYRVQSYGVRISGGHTLPVEKAAFDEANAIYHAPNVSVSAVSAAAGALIALSAIVPLAALFCYRKRKVQIAMLSVEFVLLACSAALLGWHIYFAHKEAVAAAMNYYFLFWPLLIFAAAPLNWFALSGVMRDEALVRSAYRIR